MRTARNRRPGELLQGFQISRQRARSGRSGRDHETNAALGPPDVPQVQPGRLPQHDRAARQKEANAHLHEQVPTGDARSGGYKRCRRRQRRKRQCWRRADVRVERRLQPTAGSAGQYDRRADRNLASGQHFGRGRSVRFGV
uniref:(northern house mosquito) hypothetical protein n=1 Tax=Culex pipiens TaxID=7175 RepID=A0A8D8AJ05_CULPI